MRNFRTNLEDLQDQKLVAQYIYKYLNFSNSSALKELMKIDLLRNCYRPSTLVSYLMGMRKYVETGVRVSRVPTFIFEETDKLLKRHYQKLKPSVADMYVKRAYARATTTRVSAEPKIIKPCIEIEETQPTISPLRQKVSAIKSKLELKIREYDTLIDSYKEKIQATDFAKQCAKAETLDNILAILEKNV